MTSNINCEVDLNGRKWQLFRDDNGFYIRTEFPGMGQEIEYKIEYKILRAGPRWTTVGGTQIYLDPDGTEKDRKPLYKLTIAEGESLLIDDAVKEYRQKEKRAEKSPGKRPPIRVTGRKKEESAA